MNDKKVKRKINFTVRDFMNLLKDDTNCIEIYSDLTRQIIRYIHCDSFSMSSFPEELLSKAITEIHIDSGVSLYIEDDKIPVGRIDFLYCGEVDRRIDFSDEEKFLNEVKSPIYYRVPIKIVLYKDNDGNTISQDFLNTLDTEFQSYEIIDNPYLGDDT
ncbi:MAG: hypothetical protein IJA32_11050 [Lachnospiraceae bacterium]|nr:hypothetical protein [Lachnospiraceae bacterium]